MNAKASRESEPAQPAELRRKAEDRLRASEARPAEVTSVADARALVHELQVHQIELEMQNEELQRARMEAEEASEKYFDLFDFAPTGHFLWDHEGRILEVNLAGAALLGLNRSVASHKRFGQFVASEDRGALADFLARVLATDLMQTCEVKLQRDGSSVWVLVEGIAAHDRQGPQRFCRAAVIDITQQKRADELAAANQALEAEIAARRQAEETLRQAKEEWEQTFNTVPDCVAILDDQHRIVRANRPMAERLGMTPEQCVGLRCYETVHGTTQPPDYCPHARTCRDGREHIAEMHEPRLGGHFLVSTTPRFDEQGRLIGAVHVARDITQRKRDEEEREIAAGFLRLVNESRGKEDLIRAAVTFFQEKSGCEAVGIRLKDGDDYPYYEARGFSQEFLLSENRLCAQDDAGQPIRDSAGNPVIECMCGNVICGRFDPSKPFFTARGNFWTNCTTELLASTTEADRQGRTRNRCNGQGYESVALIAIAMGEDRLGLLQLNDRQKGRFSAQSIALWERLAGYLGIALAKSIRRGETEAEGRAISHAGRLNSEPCLVGQRRRLHHLVQPPVVRVYGHDSRADGRLGLAERPRPRRASSRAGTLEGVPGYRRAIQHGVSVARARRPVPLVPHPRAAAEGCWWSSGSLVRHQHRRDRGSPGPAGCRGRQHRKEPISGEHQPRIADANERHPWHGRFGVAETNGPGRHGLSENR